MARVSGNVDISGGAGLNVINGGRLTINGGTITATGSGSAGIRVYQSSTLTINGGTVTSTSRSNHAGIGCANIINDHTGTIIINGGTVRATGGGFSAGIGGSGSSSFSVNQGGVVTITGGTVTATGGSGSGDGRGGAGIGGGGGSGSAGGTVTITGGMVTATGGGGGAGIGGGGSTDSSPFSSGGTVNIHGGTVIARGGNSANTAGIGRGNNASNSNLTGTAVATLNMNGNAMVFVSGLTSGSTLTGNGFTLPRTTNTAGVVRGILVVGNAGTFYGTNVTLTNNNVTIPRNTTLTIPANATFTIDGNVTLTNEGTVIEDENGKIVINGAWSGNKITPRFAARDLSAVYGQTLSEHSPTDIINSSKGTFAWIQTANTDVGTVAAPATVSLAFTPADTDNYHDATIGVNLRVNPKDIATATVTIDGVYTYTELPQWPLAENVTVNLDGFTPTYTYTVPSETAMNAGSAIVTVTGSGNFTGTTTGTFEIGKATPVISDLSYTNPTMFNHIYSGYAQGIDRVASVRNGFGEITVEYDEAATAPTNANTYAVRVNIAPGANYEAKTISLGNYTIVPKTLIVSADNKTVSIGEPEPQYTYTLIGLVDGETDAVIATQPAFTLDRVFSNTVGGEFIITPSGAVATENYDISYATGKLTVGSVFVVSFDINGGFGVVPASIAGVMQGNTLSAEQMPSTGIFLRSGYVNDGKWYTRAGISPNFTYTEFVFGEGGTTVTDNITLYLQWVLSISIQSYERVVPELEPDSSETAAIAPVVITLGEFIAGPNPINKQSGVVNFFWQGKSLKNGTLFVYDASGNAIGKVNISDSSAHGSQSKRVVGSWDLTDSKGRPVADGTYLVRGTLRTINGNRERVSLVLGVR